MMIFARWIEDPLDVPVQRSHYAYPSQHRWTIMFSNDKAELPSRPAIPAYRVPLFGDVRARHA
jgi:hypothetical protein